MPAVPLLPGCGALEPLPVQWSLLVRDAGDVCRAAEFLAEPGADPREPFARALIAALGDGALPIAVYSAFEAGVIERLELQLPALATPLRAIRARLVDFLELVREHVADPRFAGSYSLKRVAPVLCPDLTYSDLVGVANGAEAARLLDAWVAGASIPAIDTVRASLLAYCRRDVEALWQLHDALRALAAEAG
jgi:hypothetical protein